MTAAQERSQLGAVQRRIRHLDERILARTSVNTALDSHQRLTGVGPLKMVGANAARLAV